MSDELEDHPDLQNLDQALDFVASRDDLTYVIPWVITGREAMNFLDCYMKATAGDQQSILALWSFNALLATAVRDVLAMDPESIKMDEEE